MCIDERVDEAKYRHKKQPQQTPGKAFSRRRLKTFMDQLKERPELFEQVESIDLAQGQGAGSRAPGNTAAQGEGAVAANLERTKIL